jgi:hypothetical protein
MQFLTPEFLTALAGLVTAIGALFHSMQTRSMASKPADKP